MEYENISKKQLFLVGTRTVLEREDWGTHITWDAHWRFLLGLVHISREMERNSTGQGELSHDVVILGIRIGILSHPMKKGRLL